MAKVGAAIVGLGAALVLGACGGTEGSRTDSLDGAEWTVTILSPAHGETVLTDSVVEVALTGQAAARGEAAEFDLGYWVDEELLAQSRDTSVALTLPYGRRTLRVTGVDESGQVLEDVIGDEIILDVRRDFGPTPIDVPQNGTDGSLLDPNLGIGGIDGPLLPEVQMEVEIEGVDEAPPTPGL